MKHRKFTKSIFYFIAIFAIALIFCGCPADLKIIANPDKTFSLEFNSVFGEKLTAALEDLSQVSAQFSENQQNQSQNFDLSQMIDIKKIESELNSQYFFQSQVKVQKKSERAYNFIASAKIKNLAAFPKECLSQEELPGGKRRAIFSLNAKSVQAILRNETMLKTYTEILMAPLITGEKMSAADYEDLLSGIYGESVASELLSGKFKVDFVCPNGKILSQEISIANLLAASEGVDFAFEY